jgi:hypothetical protein
MAINYPNSLDSFVNPTSTNGLSSPSHSEQHADANDAIEALQAKIGIDGSEDTASIDYKISTLETQVNNIGDLTTTTDTLLGLEGNNDLEVSGIENKTSIDSFSKTVYRTVRYIVQVSRGSEHVSEALDVIQDGTNFYVQQVEVSSNTDNDLALLQLEENNGIISLTVTPTAGSVNARYYRTALKI